MKTRKDEKPYIDREKEARQLQDYQHVLDSIDRDAIISMYAAEGVTEAELRERYERGKYWAEQMRRNMCRYLTGEEQPTPRAILTALSKGADVRELLPQPQQSLQEWAAEGWAFEVVFLNWHRK